ncbi:MAG: class I SAM-dependent methyltransferase [Candidatus Hermodarchaeota archaeon]
MKNSSKKKDLSEEEKTLLGVIRGLEVLPKDPETGESIISEEKKIRPTKDGITILSGRALKDRIDKIPLLLETLVQKNCLLFDGETYSMTGMGRRIGKDMRTKWASEWYGDILVRSAESEAHALFCERVFGKNLCQFNVLDMEQLEAMLEALNLQPNDYVLDLGCGLGKIAEYISNRTGARFLGIDFAVEAIRWAQENTDNTDDKLTFQVGNLNELDLPLNTFDAIIAIDTLYPWNIDDLDTTMKKLTDYLKPNGQMGIFCAQIIGPNESQERLQSKNTQMATALTKNGLGFKTIDFTEDALQFWIRELSVAQELREMFEKEGNLDLCEQRIADSKNTLNNIKNQRQRRYFYHVKK